MIGPLPETMDWYIRTYISNSQGKGVDANDRDLVNFVLKLYFILEMQQQGKKVAPS